MNSNLQSCPSSPVLPSNSGYKNFRNRSLEGVSISTGGAPPPRITSVRRRSAPDRSHDIEHVRIRQWRIELQTLKKNSNDKLIGHPIRLGVLKKLQKANDDFEVAIKKQKNDDAVRKGKNYNGEGLKHIIELKDAWDTYKFNEELNENLKAGNINNIEDSIKNNKDAWVREWRKKCYRKDAANFIDRYALDELKKAQDNFGTAKMNVQKKFDAFKKSQHKQCLIALDQMEKKCDEYNEYIRKRMSQLLEKVPEAEGTPSCLERGDGNSQVAAQPTEAMDVSVDDLFFLQNKDLYKGEGEIINFEMYLGKGKSDDGTDIETILNNSEASSSASSGGEQSLTESLNKICTEMLENTDSDSIAEPEDWFIKWMNGRAEDARD